jgi:ABC-type transport system involved in multi-copper enzyme maturation permease subunit
LINGFLILEGPMSLVQSCATWFQRQLRWSNSSQSWQERLGAVLLLTGAYAVWWLGNSLTLLQQLLLWSLVLLVAAILLRRGWLKLFGPVLFYDMVRAARRNRYFALRTSYALFLLFVLWMSFLGARRHYPILDHREASRLAQNFFNTFVIVQFFAVALLTPAYVAGSIAEEKDRKTLEFLLATDLRNREIVLSKLVSRLANLTLFLLVGLPILSLVQFLGGVDPELMLAVFAITALTMLGLAGLSILNSVHFQKPRDAIALTYLGGIAYLLLSTLAHFTLGGSTSPVWGLSWLVETLGGEPLTVGMLADAFSSGNLAVMWTEVSRAIDMGTIRQVLPVVLRQYAIFHGIFATVTIVWAVLRLRAVALKQTYGKTDRGSPALLLLGRPRVANLPMVWKEVFVEGNIRLRWLGWIIVIILVGLSFYWPARLLWDYWFGGYQVWFPGEARSEWLMREMNAFVRITGTGVACLLLLAVAVRAASSVSGERDRQTLDLLLATPLETSSILAGKWLGSILSVRLACLWLLAIWGLGILTRGLFIPAALLLPIAILVYASFVATLGLWFSVVCKTTLRATVATFLTLFGLTAGPWLPWMLCGLMMRPGGGVELLLKLQAGLTPPIALGVLAFCERDISALYGSREFTELASFSVLGLFVWGGATVVLWGALNARFRHLTRHGQDAPESIPQAPLVQPVRSRRKPMGTVLLEESWKEEPEEPPAEEQPPDDFLKPWRPR